MNYDEIRSMPTTITYEQAQNRLGWRGRPFRYVLLKDLKKHLPANGVDTSLLPNEQDFQLRLRRCKEPDYNGNMSAGWWLKVDGNGVLSIGCKNFTAQETRQIYKAAGISRKVKG